MHDIALSLAALPVNMNISSGLTWTTVLLEGCVLHLHGFIRSNLLPSSPPQPQLKPLKPSSCMMRTEKVNMCSTSHPSQHIVRVSCSRGHPMQLMHWKAHTITIPSSNISQDRWVLFRVGSCYGITFLSPFDILRHILREDCCTLGALLFKSKEIQGSSMPVSLLQALNTPPTITYCCSTYLEVVVVN